MLENIAFKICKCSILTTLFLREYKIFTKERDDRPFRPKAENYYMANRYKGFVNVVLPIKYLAALFHT